MIFTTVGYKAHVHGSVSLFVIAIEVDVLAVRCNEVQLPDRLSAKNHLYFSSSLLLFIGQMPLSSVAGK